jgi:SAM-dependent methyltransferase
MSEPSAAGFFDVWDTYRKVVDGDYMFHRDIGAQLQAVLRARFGGGPFSLLDLGCGDGSALAPLLEGLAPSRYKGVDLSPAALALAAQNLERLPCPVELAQADLMSALAEAAPHDAIYSSFAVHHLPTAQKAEFFKLAARRLNAGGLLLLVDAVREEGETLDAYRQSYCDWLRGSWLGLEPMERELVCDHLLRNDMPEPYCVLRAQAEAAGLKAIAVEARHKWHRLMTFECV